MRTYEGSPTSNPADVTFTPTEDASDPYNRFEDLASKLLAVPKEEIDEQREANA